MKSTCKIKKGNGKHKAGVSEKTAWKSYIYRSKGLIFTKNESDTTQLSIGIKIQRNTNQEVDQNNMPTKVFAGSLFIGGNYMNDKRQVEQLKKLDDCIMTYNKVFMSVIVYQQRQIRVLFDFMTHEVTCIFIN
ncbi:MAG: hypothetical protein NTZ19_02605 [Bacteroidetes bacterium]|nr:hypothetical protein [Bacteroidota bacterium]